MSILGVCVLALVNIELSLPPPPSPVVETYWLAKRRGKIIINWIFVIWDILGRFRWILYRNLLYDSRWVYGSTSVQPPTQKPLDKTLCTTQTTFSTIFFYFYFYLKKISEKKKKKITKVAAAQTKKKKNPIYIIHLFNSSFFASNI